MKAIKITVILTLLVNYCFAQTLNGKYSVLSEGKEQPRFFIFKDKTFSETILKGVEGTQRKGMGEYQITAGQIIFKYITYTPQDTSFYDLTTNTNNSKSALLDVQVQEESGLPMQVNLGFKNKNNQSIVLFMTDKDGKGNLMLFDRLSTAYFIVDFIGYYRISIPAAKLLGNQSKLFVKMKPQRETYITAHEDRYVIKSFSSNSIAILSKKEGNIVLKRVD